MAYSETRIVIGGLAHIPVLIFIANFIKGKFVIKTEEAKVPLIKEEPVKVIEIKEIDYIKGVYKRKIQAEIESYKDPEDEDKRDTIQAQDILMLDRISI